MISSVLILLAQSVSWGLIGALSLFFWKQRREEMHNASPMPAPSFEDTDLGAALASTEGALSFQDANGCTRFQNAAHAALFGKNAVNFDEACQHGRIFKQPETAARFTAASTAGQSWHGEVEFAAVDGHTVALEAHALPVRGSQGRPGGAFLLFHDISTKRELDQQRERESRFERLESLGQMAGGLAHDFNTYLTVMLGFLDAARTSGPLPPKIATWLEQAERTGWRARELTQEMLEFARGAEPAKSPLRLADVIEESAQIGVQGSKAQLKFHLADDARHTEADPRQIRQVITNLVHNAAQALGSRAGTIELRLENRLQVSGGSAPPIPSDFVCLTVTDDGPGIASELLPRIFEPFYTTKAHGTGLGLAITHNIVKRHGGFVRVKSQIGVGTTFEVFLPALAAEAACTEAPVAA
jgi:two-component system, cell cycle sensor histidine kinase and response regulator CckA